MKNNKLRRLLSGAGAIAGVAGIVGGATTVLNAPVLTSDTDFVFDLTEKNIRAELGESFALSWIAPWEGGHQQAGVTVGGNKNFVYALDEPLQFTTHQESSYTFDIPQYDDRSEADQTLLVRFGLNNTFSNEKPQYDESNQLFRHNTDLFVPLDFHAGYVATKLTAKITFERYATGSLLWDDVHMYAFLDIESISYTMIK